MPSFDGAIDLSQLRQGEVVDARVKEVVNSPVANGAVDLAKVASLKHDHRWSCRATFALPDETIDLLAERRDIMAEQVAAEVEEVDVPENVGLPMGDDNLLWVDGPGCVKCGKHWESQGDGYGTKCAVSDKEWGMARAQQEEQMRQFQMQGFHKIVAEKKAAL